MITAYLTKETLVKIRGYETDDFKFNRALTDDYIKNLDPSVRLPVLEHVVHDQGPGPYPTVIRSTVILPKHGQHTHDENELGIGIVDLPVGEFFDLPTAEVM